MDNKFRNHPSLMLEQLGVFGVIIITFLISSLDDLDEILGDIKNSDSTTLLIIILVILAVILFRLAVNTIVWYKTWITVDETSITITKNTIFRSVNTIGLLKGFDSHQAEAGSSQPPAEKVLCFA